MSNYVLRRVHYAWLPHIKVLLLDEWRDDVLLDAPDHSKGYPQSIFGTAQRSTRISVDLLETAFISNFKCKQSESNLIHF